MQVEWLREFVELVNCMSFNKAAKRLYISQPTLSSHIAELEKAFGATLIIRDRPIRPTAAGISLYCDARKIIETYLAAQQRCRDLNNAPGKGELVIKVPLGGGIAKKRFMGIVEAFKKEFPFIQVNLIQGNHAYLIDELRSGRIDCGAIPVAAEDNSVIGTKNGLESLLLVSEDLGIWVDPAGPFAHDAPLKIEQLEGCRYPLPSNAQFEEFEKSAMLFFKQHGIAPRYRYVLTETFDEFLYNVRLDEVLLGVSSGLKDSSGALDGRIFIRFNPAIEHRVYMVLRPTNRNSALSIFKGFAADRLGGTTPINSPTSSGGCEKLFEG